MMFEQDQSVAKIEYLFVNKAVPKAEKHVIATYHQ
jgi:hypothetical protein